MTAQPKPAANIRRYYTDKQAKGLSSVQYRLLRRAYAAFTGTPRQTSITITATEAPSAVGLERRGLGGTRRPTAGLFHSRAVKGSVRTFWLTQAGRALVEDLGPEPVSAPAEPPLDLDEAKRLLRELAGVILAQTQMPYHRNRARAVLERLDEED